MAQRQNSIFYQVQQDQQKVADEINGMTVRLITVLSIFAGIVIAFSGGIGLLGNSFSALANNDITIYRILFLVLLIGLILYDVIVMLMFIVVRLNSKKTDLGIVCKHYYKDCYLCGSKNGTFANLFCQAINKYPHIFFVNILLLYLMYGLIVMKSYNVATEFFNGNNILFVILWLVVPVVLIFMLCSFLSKPPKKCQNDREEGCG